MRSSPLLCAALAAAVGLAVGVAGAQSYPTRIIRVINPNQPGGNSDILFRLLSPKMGEILGQQLVIDYRPGAGGNIGAEMVSKSAPDGYAVLIAAASFLINPSLIKNLPFDAIKDFTPLGLIVDIPAALVTHPSLPVRNVKELIALAKAHSGDIFFSSSGPGTIGHLSGELLNAMGGIKLVHVPYKGAGPAVVDLIAGHVQLSFVSIPAVMGYVQGGRLRMIAQGGAQRFQSIPDVPTMQEAGLPGYEAATFAGISVPKGTPKEIIDKLNRDIQAVIDSAEFRSKMGAGEVTTSSPESYRQFLVAEQAKWGKVVRDVGLTVN